MKPGDFDITILKRASHRPWPMPGRPWLMTQTWRNVLFAHWAIAPHLLRPLVPAVFQLDVFSGQGWLGIVPFVMANVAPRGLPALPWISSFPELNVRTYVRVGERPGVFFFSLDASSWMAVATARALLNLPYHRARMHAGSNSVVNYNSVRSRDPRAALEAVYEPVADARPADPGSLDYFLTERYCLYNLSRDGRPYRLDIHHPPWQLHPARATFARNTMAAAAGIELPPGPPLLHFARRQDVVAWGPEWR